MLDRTAEFRRLVAGLSGAPVPVPAPKEFGASAFLRSAADLHSRIAELRRQVAVEGAQLAEIQGCQTTLADLEASAGRIEDLGPLAPPPNSRRDLLNFRQATVKGFYEDLSELASQISAERSQEIRHETEVASFFAAAPAAVAAAAAKKPTVPVMEASASEAEPRSEALQAEEQALLASFETNLDQIHQVKQKLEEVVAMATVFATKAEEQQDTVEQILADAQTSTSHVEEAAKHLKRANENKASYNFYIVCWFVGSALFLLLFDFIDARYSWI